MSFPAAVWMLYVSFHLCDSIIPYPVMGYLFLAKEISCIYAEALGKESVVTKTVNGVEYKIYTYVKNGINHVKVYAGDTQDYCEFYLSNKKEQLVREEYDYKGRTFFGVKDYDTNIQVIDLDNSDKVNCDVIAQGITWNKKTYEHWNNDYWYKKGNSGSKVYYQIGCVAKYRIRVDNSKKIKKLLTNMHLKSSHVIKIMRWRLLHLLEQVLVLELWWGL